MGSPREAVPAHAASSPRRHSSIHFDATSCSYHENARLDGVCQGTPLALISSEMPGGKHQETTHHPDIPPTRSSLKEQSAAHLGLRLCVAMPVSTLARPCRGFLLVPGQELSGNLPWLCMRALDQWFGPLYTQDSKVYPTPCAGPACL
jgi:hypothetical protein